MGIFRICLFMLFSIKTSVASIPTVRFEWTNENCIGGERGLLSVDLWLTFNASYQMGDVRCSNHLLIAYNSSREKNFRGICDDEDEISSVEFEFEQPEHGGGLCHCVKINFGTSSSFSLCGKTANETRKLRIIWTTPNNATEIDGDDLQTTKTYPFESKCTNTPRLSIVFTIYSSNSDCGGNLNNNGRTAGDDMEVYIRFLSNPSEWIPLAVIQINKQVASTRRQGYNIPYLYIRTDEVNVVHGNITICNFSLTDSIQLRWLVTSRAFTEDRAPADVWSLDDVEITLITECDNYTLLADSFDMSELNEYWTPANIRNGRISTSCSVGSNNRALTFGESIIFQNNSFAGFIVTHAALTNVFPLNITSNEMCQLSSMRHSTSSMVPTSTIYPIHTTSNPIMESSNSATYSTSMSTEMLMLSSTFMSISLGPTSYSNMMSTPFPTPTVTSSFPSSSAISTTLPDTTSSNAISTYNIIAIENNISREVSSNPVLSTINTSMMVEIQLSQLSNITSRMSENLLQTVYVLGEILDRVTSETCNTQIVQMIANIGNDIILQSYMASTQSNLGPLRSRILGSTLLQSIEEIVIPCSLPTVYSTNQTIGIETRQVDLMDTNLIFNTSKFSGFDYPLTSFVLPLQEFRMIPVNNTINVLIDVFRNISSVLSLGPMEPPVVSDVIGISFRCGNQICPTSNISLDQPVVITFQHSSSLTDVLESNDTLTTTCIFLEFVNRSLVLSLGEWLTSGCSKNEALSSKQSTVCECTHLTHFGILLSARPIIPEDQAVALSLSIIGYVGVSVSVAAMLLTVILFLAFKSLRGLRTFLHINLCINLAIAQIIFVAGVDKTSENSVPIHCQVIAVLLHYFFLVSFMWMLMEGVFLYITLVKVFVKNMKPYYVAFILTSYGLPLLYMGGLTLPIGYGAYDETKYGYNEACFLSPDKHFVWVFIVPATLIFLTNIGFFIMAATIMWRHQKKIKENNKMTSFTNWFKAACSLTIVMGITLIIGIFLVVSEGLLFLVYIYTIMVAFQGVFIFLLYVILSKSVKDAVTKWWKVRVNESDTLNKYFGEKLSSSPGTASTNKSSDGSKSSRPAVQNEQINLATVIPNPYSFHSTSTLENTDSDVKKPYNSYL